MLRPSVYSVEEPYEVGLEPWEWRENKPFQARMEVLDVVGYSSRPRLMLYDDQWRTWSVMTHHIRRVITDPRYSGGKVYGTWAVRQHGTGYGLYLMPDSYDLRPAC